MENSKVCVYRGCENQGKEHWIPMGLNTHIYRLCDGCLEKLRGQHVITEHYQIGKLKHITECYLESEGEAC